MSDESRNNGGKSARPMPPVEHRFKPGNPGRPKGSRNKLGEAFIAALHDDFQAHGVSAIEKVRQEKPEHYLRALVMILPKELKVSTTAELSDEQLNQRIRELASAISIELNGSEEGTACVIGGAQASARPH